MATQIRPERFHISLGGLGRGKAQGHQFPGGVVDKHDQGAAGTAALEPVVGRTVDLHQIPSAGSSRAALVNPCRPALARLPQAVGDHPPAQGLATDAMPVALTELLRRQRRPEVAEAAIRGYGPDAESPREAPG